MGEEKSSCCLLFITIPFGHFFIKTIYCYAFFGVSPPENRLSIWEEYRHVIGDDNIGET
jgi:hypothetical protein